ncbi:flagellar biosynthesis regulator FlaF [Roseinatronobacter sp.]
MSIAAYKSTIRQSESPRQIERRILSRLTGALEAHVGYDTAAPFERVQILSNGLRDTLSENQTFWNELKYDLAQPANGLSPELRAGLLSIALWVHRQTSAVMGGQSGVRALADINRNIITGLSAPKPVTSNAEPDAARPRQAVQQGG